MSKLLTKGNCIFQCPYLQGTITVTSDEKGITDTSMPVLTKKCELQCVGICSLKTAQSQGAPQPCGSSLSGWISGLERNVIINGNPALNEKAKKKCNDPLVPAAFITARYMGMGHANFGTAIALTGKTGLVSGGKHDRAGDSLSHSQTNGEDIEKHPTRERGHGGVGQAEQQQTVGATQREAGKHASDENLKYAYCKYKTCSKRAECAYLGSASKVEDGSFTIELKKAEFNRFDEAEERLQLHEKSRLQWGRAAHHLICWNQVFNQFPELVMLANFYGYRIDDPKNCIVLPSNTKEGYAVNTEIYKAAKGYEVMEITGKQWHVGGHHYKISAEDWQEIPSEHRESLRCYVDQLCNEIRETIRPVFIDVEFDREMTCRYDEFEKDRMLFIEKMNRLSDTIRNALDSFRNPKDSFPYYVSSAAMCYAYKIPKSGKIVTIEKAGTQYFLRKYRYSKLKKNNNVARVELLDTCAVLDKGDWNAAIEFCGNAAYFYVFGDQKDIELPFQFRVCRMYVDTMEGELHVVSEDREEVYRLPEEQKPDVGNAMSLLRYLAAVLLMKDEHTYMGPQRVILARKRECGWI